MLEILEPRSAVAGGWQGAERLTGLSDRRLVVLWNGRRPGPTREFLEAVVHRIDADHGLAGWDVVRKPYVGNAAPDDLLREVISAADGAITGLGD